MPRRTSLLIKKFSLLFFLGFLLAACNQSHLTEQQLLDNFTKDKPYLSELVSDLQSSKIELGVASDFGYQILPKGFQQHSIKQISVHKFADIESDVYLFPKSQQSRLTFTETFKGYAYLPEESEYAQIVSNLDEFIEQAKGPVLVFRRIDGEASWYLYYQSVTLE